MQNSILTFILVIFILNFAEFIFKVIYNSF